MKQTDIVYFVDEHYDQNNQLNGVHEGTKKNGENDGLMRNSDVKSSVLEWSKQGKLDGK